MSGFVHLHCHSTWSLRDGAISAESLPHLAADLGFEAVALTDHDALTGAVRFSQACRDAGIKPIFGAELTVAPQAVVDSYPTSVRMQQLGGRADPPSGTQRGGRPDPPGGTHRGGRADPREGAGHAGIAHGGRTDHVTVIVRDKTGYANLCRLISDAHLSNERDHPVTTMEAIAERAEGLFILSGCARGEVARLAASGAIPEARAAAERWRDAIGDGYRIEVFDHREYGDRMLRDRLLGIGKGTGVRVVATNDVHYAAPAEAAVHEVLHAIKEIVPLSRSHALRRNSEYCLKPGREMTALFDDVPEALSETARVAEECDYDLDLGSYHFPDIPIPRGRTATGLLAHRAFEGAADRFGSVTKVVEDRLQHELGLIFRMGFASYFLLVADIVDHARRVLGIRCACRGSAAGSLVCYVLGISDVDPIRYDLLFERFMNTRREEIPDIDVDVESHRREEVLEHILATYGSEQTAMCCMVDTFKARMAIRDVGKALGLPNDEIDLVAKAFPRISARHIPEAIDRLPELAGTNLKAGQLQQLFDLCIAIDGFPRHLALHPSGVILSAPDLADRVPMQTSFGGFTMLQADKDDAEALGLAKLDILGVRMLSSIAHTHAEIERVTGRSVDLDAIPRDDDATFRLIRSSRTLGCFQIESPGQRELLARFQPSRFEDLIIDISLFRPGPVKSDMISPFLDRRHGFEDFGYTHPWLRPILAETNGVVVYHEQVIRVIAAATGCSLDDADYVRRHLEPDAEWNGVAAPIGIPPPDAGIGVWFQERAVANGFTAPQAAALWKEVFAFASFGFCKSHAAAFALPTYISAWLKAHHPAEFYAGILTHDPGMYPRRLIVSDARQLGVPILPIDVNASDATYRVEPPPVGSSGESRTAVGLEETGALAASSEDCLSVASTPAPEALPRDQGVGEERRLGVRLALSEVRGISDAEIDSIVAARQERPFASLEDLHRRAELSRPVLENLVHVGALDSTEPAGGRSRRELLWRTVELCSGTPVRNRSSDRRRGPGAGQLALDLDASVQPFLPDLPSYSPLEETEAELEVSGIDARRHVMDLYRPLLAELGCVAARDLGRCRNDSEVWVAGVKVASQTPAIRSGQRIIFVTIDDLTGPIDVTVFERVQPRCARTVFHCWLLLVKGVVRKRGGASFLHETDPRNVGITVVVDEVFDLVEIASARKAGANLSEALGRQRRRHEVAGLAEPGGDLQPRARMWHASGGSAGR